MTTGSHHSHHHSSHHHHNGGTSHLDGPGAHSDISNQLAQLNEGWLELESDPGLFSSLITDFGCRGVKVEEIYDLERPFTDPEERPTIYGFIFLFNVIEERRNRLRSALPGGVETVSPSSLLSGEYMAEGEELLKEMFFAYQKVPNSCATHAILSVLMNCQEQIDLGALLLRLKEYTKDMSPENKGYAISNMPELAQAHNSHAAPSSSQKEQQLKQSSSSSGAIRISSRHTSSAEAFHFVSFVPINGRLIELDGLKELPIDHGPIESSSDGHDDWTEKFRRLIRARIETPHGVEHDIRYNLMAVIPSRFEEAYEKMARMLRQRYMLLKIMEALEFTGQIGVFRDHAYTHTEVMETSFRSNPFVVGQSVGHFGSRRIEVDFVEGKLVKDEKQKLNDKESNQLLANSIKPEHQPPPIPSTMEPPAPPQMNGNCTRTRNASNHMNDEKNIHGRGFKITYDVYQNPLPDEDDDDEEGEKKVKDEDVKSEFSDSESTDSFVSSDSQLEPKSRAWFERVRAREEKEEAIPPGILSPPYKTVYMETSEDAFQDNERFWTLKFEYKPDPPGYVNPYDSVPPPRASSPLPPEVKVEPKVEVEVEEQIKNVQNESQIVEAKVLDPKVAPEVEVNPEAETNPDTEVKSEADEIEDVSIEIVTPPSTLSGESPPTSSQSSDLGKRRSQDEEDSNEVKRQKTCSDSSQPEVVVVATDSEGSQPEPEVVDYHNNSKQEEIECIDLSDEDAANSSIEVIEIKPEDDDDDGFETEVIEVKPGDIEEDEEPEEEKEPETVVMPETVDFVEGSTLSGGDVEVVVPPITDTSSSTISGTTEQNPLPETENSMEVDVKQVESEVATAKTNLQTKIDGKTDPQTEVDAKTDPQTEVDATKTDPQPEIDSKTNPQPEVDVKTDTKPEVVVSKSIPEQEVDFAHMQTPPSQSDSVVTSSMNGDEEQQDDEGPSTASLSDPYFEDYDDKDDDDDVNKLRSEEVRLMSRLLRYAREQKNQPWTGSQFERRLKPVILSDLSNLFFYLNNEIMKWNKILNEERRILQKQLTDDTRRVHDYDAFINLFITLFFEQGLMDKVIGKELCVNSASGSGTSAATAAASSTSTGNSSTSNNHHENHHTTTHAQNGRSGTSASTISSNSNGGGGNGFKVLDPSRVATVQSEYKALGHRLGVDNGYFLFPCNFNISDHAAAEKLWFAPGDVPLPGRDDNADREPEEVDS